MKSYLWIIFMVLLIVPVSGAQFYVAKGDEAYVTVDNPGGSCWFFKDSDTVDTARMYDMPSYSDGINTFCPISEKMSYAMDGDYILVYTYPLMANNRTVVKDITWNNGELVSIFAGSSKIKESGTSGRIAKADLLHMISLRAVDGIEEYTLKIDDPYVTLKNIYGKTEVLLHASGTSNFEDGTQIRITIDEMERDSIGDLANFTFKTTVSRKYIESEGTWSTDMLVPMQHMGPGWHTINVYAGKLVTTSRFPLYQAWEPSPTPKQYINYFGNGSIKPEVVIVEKTVIQKEYIDRWHTATPTPAITDALGDPIDYPYDAGETIPAPVGIVAIVAIAILAIVRDYKWK